MAAFVITIMLAITSKFEVTGKLWLNVLTFLCILLALVRPNLHSLVYGLMGNILGKIVLE